MQKPISERPDRRKSDRRKLLDRAIILLLVGIALLMPPLAGIFQMDFRIFGIPVTLLYLFLVWGLLIGCAALLSGPLQRKADWHHSKTSSTPNSAQQSSLEEQ